ncbi:sorting nexin-4 [Geosmithia morbida]|uniref:Sorting nexin-4 n=1 Tax=Geosmithia morbida TaxID=1094350 RepID=A0A9P5D2A4_9HYPO|nr:sorting nexin-4 [Geosmithia morbida]KAF4124818.1 sorting nexin-4 [Geosmithia morbida]
MAVTSDQDNFSNVSWSEHAQEGESAGGGHVTDDAGLGFNAESNTAGADTHRLGSERLECTVDTPIKENDGTKDAFVSYLITTSSTFQSFQREHTSVRRRFTDFVFLYKQLTRDFPATAVPPIPDKQRMEYVRGDRFGSDFTSRRAHSLQRFLTRLSLHPTLRRAPILHSFLESPDWNATMRSQLARHSNGGGDMGVGSGGGGGGGGGGQGGGPSGVFDNFADTFINAFTKVNRPDRRFLDVKDKSDKLDEDLAHIEKVVSRVARRESDLETDMRDLAEQFQRLMALEPGVEPAVRAFAFSVEDAASGLRRLHDVTDQDYLGSLRDMQAYSLSLRQLLKAREQKQLDHEQLSEYLAKSTAERDALQAQHAGHGGYAGTGVSGAGGYLRNKFEDVRGVDHEQSRRERARKLELRVDELTAEVERARATSDLFDEEVVHEVDDFERIKRIEFKTQLGGLADAHIGFYGDLVDLWSKYILQMEGGSHATVT